VADTHNPRAHRHRYRKAGTADRQRSGPVSGAPSAPPLSVLSAPALAASSLPKCLQQHGIAYDCFEKGSGIGGTWRFRNDNGLSACYRSLHINTSKRMMVLSDFPFKPRVSEYPTAHPGHPGVLQAYVDHHFAFDRTSPSIPPVTHVEATGDGRFQWILPGRGGYKGAAITLSSWPTAITGNPRR